jgi:hypothetical protein
MSCSNAGELERFRAPQPRSQTTTSRSLHNDGKHPFFDIHLCKEISYLHILDISELGEPISG